MKWYGMVWCGASTALHCSISTIACYYTLRVNIEVKCGQPSWLVLSSVSLDIFGFGFDFVVWLDQSGGGRAGEEGDDIRLIKLIIIQLYF